MSSLNKTAAEVLVEFEVHACTDVTGFGLAGHLHEMSSASEVEVELTSAAIPVLNEARELASMGVIPGGTISNMEFMEGKIVWPEGIDSVTKVLLCDAQTSGGLLAAVEPKQAAAAIERLHQAGVESAVDIGLVTRGGRGTIHVKQ
jgi:selenide,water dikinase